MTGTLLEDQYRFLINSRSFLLKREIFQTKILEKMKTHNNIYFKKSYFFMR